MLVVKPARYKVLLGSKARHCAEEGGDQECMVDKKWGLFTFLYTRTITRQAWRRQ